jgi:magnesium transporter
MIRALLYDRTNNEITAGGKELLSVWENDGDTCLWLDIEAEPGDAGAGALMEAFGLHPLAIQDAQRGRHPPKLEGYDDSTFVLLKGLSTEATGLKLVTIQLAVFISERFLLTRRTGSSPSTDTLYERARGDVKLFGQGPAALAVRLFRLMVDRYLKVLLALEPRLEAIEEEIMRRPDDTLLAEILNYKTELKKFRRVFLYHQQIFHELRAAQFPAIGTEREHEIVDVYEQQERAGSLAGLYYELASDLADGYISVTSHHLNQIMKVLTVVMSIFVPLSFLAGIYGMNFENMPELHSRSGYFILLGIMATIVAVLLTVFRRKRWL